MTFTASNGIRVKLTENHHLIIENEDGQYPATAAVGVHVDALREFFQHEKDEQLGRWRSKNDPAWTAVRHEGNVTFQHEHGTRSFNITINDTASLNRWTKELQAIAHEYLEAHPESKPWHDAQPGEAWLLTIDGEEIIALRGVDEDFYTTRSGYRVIRYNRDDITAGRRIYPVS